MLEDPVASSSLLWNPKHSGKVEHSRWKSQTRFCTCHSFRLSNGFLPASLPSNLFDEPAGPACSSKKKSPQSVVD